VLWLLPNLLQYGIDRAVAMAFRDSRARGMMREDWRAIEAQFAAGLPVAQGGLSQRLEPGQANKKAPDNAGAFALRI
jgi:hypothetical protein